MKASVSVVKREKAGALIINDEITRLKEAVLKLASCRTDYNDTVGLK